MWLNFLPLLLWMLLCVPMIHIGQLLYEKSQEYEKTSLSKEKQAEALAKFYLFGCVVFGVIGIVCVLLEMKP